MLDKYDQKDRFFFFFWCFLTPENIINVVTRYLIYCCFDESTYVRFVLHICRTALLKKKVNTILI